MAKVYGEIVADVAKESTSQKILESLQGEGTEKLISAGTTTAVSSFNSEKKSTLFELHGSGKLHWATGYVYLKPTASSNVGNLDTTNTYAYVEIIVDGVTVLYAGGTPTGSNSSSIYRYAVLGNHKFIIPYDANGSSYPSAGFSIGYFHSHCELSDTLRENFANHYLANYLEFKESVVIKVTAKYKNTGSNNTVPDSSGNIAKYSVGYTLDE